MENKICSYCGKEYSNSEEDKALMCNNILLDLYCSRNCFNQRGLLKPLFRAFRHIYRAISKCNKLQINFKGTNQ